MNAEVWCTVHNTFAVACCECRNNEERAVAPVGKAVGATLPPLFGTAMGAASVLDALGEGS